MGWRSTRNQQDVSKVRYFNNREFRYSCMYRNFRYDARHHFRVGVPTTQGTACKVNATSPLDVLGPVLRRRSRAIAGQLQTQHGRQLASRLVIVPSPRHTVTRNP